MAQKRYDARFKRELYRLRENLFQIIYMDGFGRMHLDLPEKDVGAQRLSITLGVSQELASLMRGGVKKCIEAGHLPRLKAKLERSKQVRKVRKKKKQQDKDQCTLVFLNRRTA